MGSLAGKVSLSASSSSHSSWPGDHVLATDSSGEPSCADGVRPVRRLIISNRCLTAIRATRRRCAQTRSCADWVAKTTWRSRRKSRSAKRARHRVNRPVVFSCHSKPSTGERGVVLHFSGMWIAAHRYRRCGASYDGVVMMRSILKMSACAVVLFALYACANTSSRPYEGSQGDSPTAAGISDVYPPNQSRY